MSFWYSGARAICSRTCDDLGDVDDLAMNKVSANIGARQWCTCWWSTWSSSPPQPHPRGGGHRAPRADQNGECYRGARLVAHGSMGSGSSSRGVSGWWRRGARRRRQQGWDRLQIKQNPGRHTCMLFSLSHFVSRIWSKRMQTKKLMSGERLK